MATNELFQFSVVSALMDGVAARGIPIGDLLSHGGHGLGTFRYMVGEMIILDGAIYQMKSDGSVGAIDTAAPGDPVAPFAMVTRFQPTGKSKSIVTSKEALSNVLSGLFPSTKNLYLAFRIEGVFKSLTVRTVGGQQVPHQGLAELGKNQASHSFSGIRGTIIGFRSPSFMQGISVAGDHLHFISADRSHGGHILACEAEGEVEVLAAPLCKIHLQLPQDDDEFNEAQLKSDVAGIARVEG